MHAPVSLSPSLPQSPLPRGRDSGGAGAFLVADWLRVIFIHYAVKPADLAPLVPHPLDVVDGRAFISLVSFSLERLRPGHLLPARLGRALLGPISEHAFLNLRTYVRGPAGPGIHFLAEWINNPWSLRLGPLTYGLPYRLAHIQRADLPAGGLTQIHVREVNQDLAVGITVPLQPSIPLSASKPGSLDAFLVERYTAYTAWRGIHRYFHIAHRPWDVARVDLVRTETGLLERMYPWFKHAELVGAHIGPGVRDVIIGRPHHCGDTLGATAGVPANLPGVPAR